MMDSLYLYVLRAAQNIQHRVSDIFSLQMCESAVNGFRTKSLSWCLKYLCLHKTWTDALQTKLVPKSRVYLIS